MESFDLFIDSAYGKKYNEDHYRCGELLSLIDAADGHVH